MPDMPARYAGLARNAFDAPPSQVKRGAEAAIVEGGVFLLFPGLDKIHALVIGELGPRILSGLQRFPGDGKPVPLGCLSKPL